MQENIYKYAGITQKQLVPYQPQEIIEDKPIAQYQKSNNPCKWDKNSLKFLELDFPEWKCIKEALDDGNPLNFTELLIIAVSKPGFDQIRDCYGVSLWTDSETWNQTWNYIKSNYIWIIIGVVVTILLLLCICKLCCLCCKKPNDDHIIG